MFLLQEEADELIANGCLNGLFVLGRSVGFIGHFLDQKRLKQPLYRCSSHTSILHADIPNLIHVKYQMWYSELVNSHHTLARIFLCPE